jgi:hypothetical protein
MTLGGLIDLFLAEQRTECQLLDAARVRAQGVAAAHFYAGYGHFNVLGYAPTGPSDQPLTGDSVGQPIAPVPFSELALSTVVTPSDWAVVRPLFLLYCEREQALMLEASRVMGVDVFGRASSEVQQDINTAEADLPLKAFIQPVFSV